MNRILTGDVFDKIREIPDNYIDAVITDPPYFLDKFDDKWNIRKITKKHSGVIQSHPSGMKFSRKQGIRFYEFYSRVSKEVFRVLKPGGYFFSFSSPRLYHRLASAMDDSGFEIRDCFIWLHTQNQPKAMSLSHFIRKLSITDKKKRKLIKRLEGWKTPQLKSCYEPIAMGQKPLSKTFLNNAIKHKVGLLNVTVKVGSGAFPANVVLDNKIIDRLDKLFLVSKASIKEKGTFNTHKSVKPLAIMEHLIKLCIMNKKAIILDPFAGSGTTLIAAKNLGLNYIGIELNPEYVRIAKRRLMLLTR